MKIFTRTSRPRPWSAAVAGLSLLVLIVAGACGSEQADTQPPPAAATGTAQTVQSIAEEIAVDVGKVMDAVEGSTDQTVIVLEETHSSPAGQAEIAIMLNRLYERYGMRRMGLEGSLSEEGYLNVTWLGSPSLVVGQTIGPREDVIVQLLEDGEISSAEMMALTYADAQVAGVDSPEYRVEPPDEAWTAATIYLYEIAVSGLTQSEIGEANDLIEQGKEDEAFEFIIETDGFTREAHERLTDPAIVMSCEELLDLFNEIEARAADVAADITPEDEENLEALRTFFQACSVRSGAMVTNTVALVGQAGGAPVAMTAGAAHTERVKELLADAGVSFAVIQPSSFAEGRENGDLSSEAYDRKEAVLSVDPPGSLGALLDGRRKPPPVVGELWAESKAEVFFLTTSLARAAAEGQLPPFDDALRDAMPQLQNTTLVPNTVHMDENDVVFSVETFDNNSRPVVLWIRARVDQEIAEQTLEARLFQGLSNVQNKDEPSDDPESSESEPRLHRVSSDTIAKVAKDQTVIVNTRLGG